MGTEQATVESGGEDKSGHRRTGCVSVVIKTVKKILIANAL